MKVTAITALFVMMEASFGQAPPPAVPDLTAMPELSDVKDFAPFKPVFPEVIKAVKDGRGVWRKLKAGQEKDQFKAIVQTSGIQVGDDAETIKSLLDRKMSVGDLEVVVIEGGNPVVKKVRELPEIMRYIGSISGRTRKGVPEKSQIMNSAVSNICEIRRVKCAYRKDALGRPLVFAVPNETVFESWVANGNVTEFQMVSRSEYGDDFFVINSNDDLMKKYFSNKEKEPPPPISSKGSSLWRLFFLMLVGLAAVCGGIFWFIKIRRTTDNDDAPADDAPADDAPADDAPADDAPADDAPAGSPSPAESDLS